MKFALKSLYACLSLLAVAILASACGLGKQGGLANGEPRYLYAQIKGEVREQSRTYQVDRVLVVDNSLGFKMVSSSIMVVEDVNGLESKFSKQLYEYCIDDSLFVFDTSDSSYLVLNTVELQEFRSELLPYSASWVFDKSQRLNKFEVTKTDTVWYGLACMQYDMNDFNCIAFKDYNLAIHSTNLQLTQNEDVIKITLDTVLAPEVFVPPQGFTKMRYSD